MSITQDGIEFFNVGELTEVRGMHGSRRLSRFPQRLETSYLLPGGKNVTRQASGVQLRFRMTGDQANIRLSADTPAKGQVLQGDYWLGGFQIQPGQMVQVPFERSAKLARLPEHVLAEGRYSNELFRILIEGGIVHFHELDTYGRPVEVPRPEDSPLKRWLAYGSSITHADGYYGYINSAAELLGVDVLNKGMSGSCGMEKETAEFMVNENDWDFATLELGVNLRNSIDGVEFARRLKNVLDAFVPTGKPIFLITIFPNSCRFDPTEAEVKAIEDSFNAAVHAARTERAAPNLHIIEGSDVLKQYTWLAGDMIHPSHRGCGFMGRELAAILRERLGL